VPRWHTCKQVSISVETKFKVEINYIDACSTVTKHHQLSRQIRSLKNNNFNDANQTVLGQFYDFRMGVSGGIISNGRIYLAYSITTEYADIGLTSD